MPFAKWCQYLLERVFSFFAQTQAFISQHQFCLKEIRIIEWSLNAWGLKMLLHDFAIGYFICKIGFKMIYNCNHFGVTFFCSLFYRWHSGIQRAEINPEHNSFLCFINYHHYHTCSALSWWEVLGCCSPLRSDLLPTNTMGTPLQKWWTSLAHCASTLDRESGLLEKIKKGWL